MTLYQILDLYSKSQDYSQNVPIVFNSGPVLLFLLFFLTSTAGMASNRVGFRIMSLLEF